MEATAGLAVGLLGAIFALSIGVGVIGVYRPLGASGPARPSGARMTRGNGSREASADIMTIGNPSAVPSLPGVTALLGAAQLAVQTGPVTKASGSGDMGSSFPPVGVPPATSPPLGVASASAAPNFTPATAAPDTAASTAPPPTASKPPPVSKPPTVQTTVTTVRPSDQTGDDRSAPSGSGSGSPDDGGKAVPSGSGSGWGSGNPDDGGHSGSSTTATTSAEGR